MLKHTAFSIVVIFLLGQLPLIGSAQETRITFLTGLSWQQVQARAKAENKYIFIDCYTTWCGPCKYMDKEIFTRKPVADFFTAHFISVKLQLDSTAGDPQPVKDWRATAKDMERQYKVNVYPTYLFLSPEGRIVHRFSGACASDTDFINRASRALDPARQYYTLMAGWEEHRTDSAFLLQALIAARNAGDKENQRRLMNAYAACLQTPLTRSNIDLFPPALIGPADTLFRLYMNHPAMVDAITAKGYVETILARIVFEWEISPVLPDSIAIIRYQQILAEQTGRYPGLDRESFASSLTAWLNEAIIKEIRRKIASTQHPVDKDWKSAEATLTTRFPGFDHRKAVQVTHLTWLYEQKAWEPCAAEAMDYLDQFASSLSPATMNEIVWRAVFVHSNNKKLFGRAAQVMERVIAIVPEDPNYLDTYANLLYKAGRVGEALQWEEKAVELAGKKKQRLQEFTETLGKMKSGKPTWGDAAGS